ncbi:MAG: S8 family peptidase [Clostridium sp.]|nr:S8 family peptidase [Clostridium sp.]MCM1171213.1 S8 family peptidase [Clostridium sp.]MCM1208880.1 S8 family peptidase [Ruminococcus sp.]
MDNFCSDYIYSDEYFCFLVKYDNDMNRVDAIFDPACVSRINSRFLVAYTKPDSININEFLKYGYASIPKCFGLMDSDVLQVIGADRIRNLPGLGYAGEGVLIGFIDTGIDFVSDAFRNPDGTTRISSIWDQNQAVYGLEAAVYGYGAVFTEEKINEALESDNPYSIVPSLDEDGHGTFIASVAAGNEGVSPKSDIIMVKLKQAKSFLRQFFLIPDEVNCYSEDDVMLAIKYLVEQAAVLGKPLVICLGIGTNQGGHTGNTYLETYINSITQLRGIGVCVSAGNETGFGTHFHASEISGDSADVEISVGSNDKGFTLELWGKAPGVLDVSVISPTGEVFDGISAFKSMTYNRTFLYEGTTVYVETTIVEGTTGDPLALFRFENPTEGVWIIRVQGDGNTAQTGFDAWLPIHRFNNSDTRFVSPSPDVTICSPGNARGIITVAGYDYRNNAIYVNSSRGFTRTDGIKPDVAAPAVDVQGVFARRTDGPSGNVLYIRRSGTSIASAVTAGGIALILQWAIVEGNYINVTNETIKRILMTGARRTTGLAYPNRQWGYGAIDLYESFNALRR